MARLLLINVYGPRQLMGLGPLLRRISDSKAIALDVRQFSIGGHVSLSVLASVDREEPSHEQFKRRFATAHPELEIAVTSLDGDELAKWLDTKAQERLLVTILGRNLRIDSIQELATLLEMQGLAIEEIRRLSDLRSPEAVDVARPGCFELSVLGPARDKLELRRSIMDLADSQDVDISIQSESLTRGQLRLVVFDMDSTLIQCEVIDELARIAGVYDDVSAITERAMRGDLDFKSSFTERLARLKGLDMQLVRQFAKSLPLMDGAERLFSGLKQLGFKTAICSGGFTLMGRELQSKLGIDYVFANELEEEDGRLTGRVRGEIVDGERKALLMRNMAAELGLNLSQIIAVGDGANDLPMIAQAGLGIAFRAKPLVRASAPHVISTLGLDAILYLIGIRDRDLSDDAR